MEFSRRSRQRPKAASNLDSMLEWLTPHNVALYVIPPAVDLSIGEFESLALERLKLLRILEHAGAKNQFKPMSAEWREAIFAEMNHDDLKPYVRLCQGNHSKELDISARRRDYLSHFILRFAYCRSDELRRWFIAREMELFRLKFSGLSSQDIKDFVQKYEMSYTPLNAEQKNEIKDGLYDSTIYHSVVQIEALDFYKVRFTEVLDLVRGRKCYIQGGFAFVCASDFVSIIAAKHQQLLEDGLQAHLKLLPELENDERFVAVLKSLHTSYTGKDYTIARAGEVPIESIDQLSKKSFPLCMRYCHDTLRTKHHHRHEGRLQYGLFLKGIGVTLDDSIRFWREEFIRGTVTLEKFEKEYVYNIRFNYGKEGSRINYSPYSCMKIITSNVGPTDTHGCPFKIWEPSVLKSKLNGYGMGAAHVDEIAAYVSKGHYQIACGKYFEISHQHNLDEGINHPNQYFELSQITMGARAPKAKPAPRRTFNVGNSQDSGTMNPDDDDELWQLMDEKELESQTSDKRKASDSKGAEKLQKVDAGSSNPGMSEWGDDDDFDVSQVELE